MADLSKRGVRKNGKIRTGLVAGGELVQVPKYELPEQGIDPRLAYEMIKGEILLDGSARLNLATFVTTYMEAEASDLYRDTVDKNIVDKDEYPQTAEIEERCVQIIGRLWSGDPDKIVGTSTTGSSEAAMLAGLALKRRWQHRGGKGRPNIVFSSAVQVVWEKFANYFEVEPRYVPVSENSPVLDAEGVLGVVDENTIGVVPILGVTYTGSYEPVSEICDALDELASGGGPDIPVHVDAASGGFVAPFLDPDLGWDFRLERVASINASGHKFGLVYPGLGWVLWRSREVLPSDLVFKVAYLGGEMETFGLNFSRPGAQVILQYYNFVRLGKSGYTAVMSELRRVAGYIAESLANTGRFEVLADGSELPVVCVALKPDQRFNKRWTLHDLSARLRERGWQVPVYPMPANLEEMLVMRVVVRNGFRMDLAEIFMRDLARAISELDDGGGAPVQRSAFHH
jgi:glutamate decarboxylase